MYNVSIVSGIEAARKIHQLLVTVRVTELSGFVTWLTKEVEKKF